jgi:single-strand DNA-binding protein
MSKDLNKVSLIGRLGGNPEKRSLQSGDVVVSFSLATGESWKDAQTGEKQERTHWHKIVIYNQGLAKVANECLRKGGRVYLEGQLENRSWEKDGATHYATEVVLRPYSGELIMLDTKPQA